ncbi:MAG: chromate efflux transporter [Acidobacteria bacterium]|nr:MAG: chromate efflux transporter [Acidobacteriota bacterium]
MESQANSEKRGSLGAIVLVFLKLGVIGFGGPAAHVAMMDDEVVRRRRWLSRDEFLDLLGAANLIPGPNSTEMAIHVGRRQAGWPGLILGGACFILPAAFIVTAFAWAYVRYGSLPEVAGVLYGVKPVIIAIVLQALISLGRTALRSVFLAAVAAVATALAFLGVNELLLLVGGGVVMMAGKWRPRTMLRLVLAWPLGVIANSAGGIGSNVGLWPLFWFFVKVGSILYGSGYVLLAFIRADLVERWRWLTETQLLDEVAVGQVTPGPVFTTATFIGYLLAGPLGAAVATVGIFLPAFVFVAVSSPLIPRIRRSPLAGAFLDGVNAASLALMFFVTFQLGMAALVDLPTLILAAGAALALFRFRVNSAWLVLGGGLLGLALQGL